MSKSKKEIEAIVRKFKAEGTVAEEVLISRLFTKWVAGKFTRVLTNHFDSDGEQWTGKNVYAATSEHTAFIWQVWDASGNPYPLCIDVWDREVEREEVKVEPDWNFQFDYEMPADPMASMLAAVISQRGKEIVEEVIREYVYPGLSKLKKTTIEEYLKNMPTE